MEFGPAFRGTCPWPWGFGARMPWCCGDGMAWPSRSPTCMPFVGGIGCFRICSQAAAELAICSSTWTACLRLSTMCFMWLAWTWSWIEFGNSSRNQNLLAQLYWSRLRGCLLRGPPCETWSVAPGKAIPTKPQRQAPRIPRTASQLWGLPCLALKELSQVLTGNQLLIFTLLVASRMVSSGSLGVVEHPAEPLDDDAAAIVPSRPCSRSFMHLELNDADWPKGFLGRPPPSRPISSSLTCRIWSQIFGHGWPGLSPGKIQP